MKASNRELVLDYLDHAVKHAEAILQHSRKLVEMTDLAEQFEDDPEALEAFYAVSQLSLLSCMIHSQGDVLRLSIKNATDTAAGLVLSDPVAGGAR